MFLRDEYTRTIKGGSPTHPVRALLGLSSVGGERDFGGVYRQLEMSQAEAHYL